VSVVTFSSTDSAQSKCGLELEFMFRNEIRKLCCDGNIQKPNSNDCQGTIIIRTKTGGITEVTIHVSISSLTFMKKRMTLGELGQFSLVYFTHISHNAITNLRVGDTDI
jgi:hypothetical protein